MADSVSYKYVLPPTLFYFSILFGLSPLFTQVIVAQVCYQKGYDEDDCDGSDVSSEASLVVAGVAVALYVPTILTTGPYGAIANRYGRKPVLFAALIGALVYASGYLYVSLVRTEYFASIIILGSFFYGMAGGYSSFVMGIFSYAADATALDPALRKQSYPVTEACIFIPKLVCPILTGIYASYFGFVLPLLLGVILCSCGAIWVLFIPESLPMDSECRRIPLSLNPLQTLHNMSALFQIKPASGRSPIPYISLAFCIAYTCYIGFGSVFLLYAKHTYHWGPDMIGYFDGADGLCTSVSMLLVPAIVHSLAKKEFKLLSWIQTGYCTRCIFFAGIAITSSTVPAFLMLLVTLPGGLVAPYTRTILSNSVPLAMQAQIFAGFSAVESVATLISPMFAFGYSITTSAGFPQGMFILMSVLLAVSFAIVTFVRNSDELFSNLPDQRHSIESDVKRIDMEPSIDEDYGHFRGYSAAMSGDFAYSVDAQINKYRFEKEKGDSTERLLSADYDFR